jgi:23S rRNA (uracil1939-C5)-methyltransferase
MTESNAKNEVTLAIDALSYGPYGIGRLEGKAVMIPHTAPGDTVLAGIVESKERYAVGSVVRLIRSSGLRQQPPCPYVPECGGCSWQHLSYEAQLKAKEQNVSDALRRIGKLDGFELRPILSSPDTYHYRRRIRLQRDGKAVGFFRAFSHDLVEVESCLIADEKVNQAIEPVRDWTGILKTPLEHVEIVTGDEADEIVAVAEAAAEFAPGDAAACEALVAESSIGGVIVRRRGWRKTWGATELSLMIEPGTSLKVQADLFTQVNTKGNRRMVSELLQAGEFTKDDRVLELYSGAGNFTIALAKLVRGAAAVEGYRPAVESAKRSAQLNGIDNIDWLCAPVPDTVARLKKRRERFSKIVLDPPRAGAKGIERDLAVLGADKILYVSCNPTTLARDVSGLSKHGYRLRTVQPIDLFPHTFHVEAIAELVR